MRENQISCSFLFLFNGSFVLTWLFVCSLFTPSLDGCFSTTTTTTTTYPRNIVLLFYPKQTLICANYIIFCPISHERPFVLTFKNRELFLFGFGFESVFCDNEPLSTIWNNLNCHLILRRNGHTVIIGKSHHIT